MARMLIDQALSQTGPVPELLDTRAVVHLAAGDVQLALADLKSAVDSSSAPDPAKLFHLAVAQLRSGNVNGARQTYDRALAADFESNNLHPLEKRLFASELNTLTKR